MLAMKGMLHNQSNGYRTYGCTKAKSLECFLSSLQLENTELLDSFSEQKVGTLSEVQHDDRIGFNNDVFSWSDEAGDMGHPESSGCM